MNLKSLAKFFLTFLFLTVLFWPPPLYAAELVNINTADVVALDTVPEIGPTIAQRIIDYRRTNGPFTKIEDIQKITGIGSGVTYDKIKSYITVGNTGSQNVSVAATSSAQTQAQKQEEAPPSAAVSSYVAPPAPEVFADAGDNRTVIVGADVLFNGLAYNRQKEILTNVRFLWNFGDGAVADGSAVLHHFEYPGRYAVVLTIAENKNASMDQVVVLAEPANLAFFNLSDGGVRIENRAGRDLDLSRWVVRQFGRDFPLPEHSMILAASSMLISQKTLGFWRNPSVEFDYPNGVLALRAGESAGITSIAVELNTADPAPVASDTVALNTPSTPVAPKVTIQQDDPGEVLGTSVSAESATSTEQENTSSTLWISLATLVCLLGVGAALVHYLQSRPNKKEETFLSADEFDIE